MKRTVLALLVLMVATAFAQEADLKVAPVSPITLPPPVTLPPIISPPVCFADSALQTFTAADSEPDDPVAAADSLTYRPPVRRCEDGPVRKLLGGPNVFYWPPIYQRTCNNLFCKDPPCLARKTVWVSRCVLVYKFVNGCWRRLGFRTIRYLDHVECSCKTCRDIRDKIWCEKTTPCPNTKSEKDFCYWIPGPIGPIGKRQAVTEGPDSLIPIPWGRCDCCTPIYCPYPKIFNNRTCSCVCPSIRCPPGRIFNPKTCQCDCPPGTTLVDGKCVGDCSDVDLSYCRHVACRENKHFNCVVKDNKCICPSCDAAKDLPWCIMTKCQEQPMRHKCKWEYGRCRCPTCADQPDKPWCDKTKCGPGFNVDCWFNYHTGKCSCPYVKG